MIERLLISTACSPSWGRQMRFIAGPRQSGKTTLAKEHLKAQGNASFYYNWDNREIKIAHNQTIDFIKRDLLSTPDKKKINWVCFDEIHKMPKWKNILKSYFDTYEDRVRFLITGSARLDLFRRSGDSLAGRYFLFHLFPLNLFELTRKPNAALKPELSAEDFIEKRISNTRKTDQASLEALLAHSGFPEPFLKSDASFQKLWQKNNLDILVREDLRDLTRISELENVAALITLLPSKIGSPLSINSLTTDIEVRHETMQNYLRALKLCYVLFELPTYAKKINRSIKKEKKVYFFDWTLSDEPAKRFENYIAVELFSWVNLWSDAGLGQFDLRYIKNRNGQECDFLILKDNTPWLLVETKLKDGPLASHLYHFSTTLGNIPIIQLVQENEILHVGKQKDYRISASRFLSA